MNKNEWGWNASREEEYAPSAGRGLFPARVFRENRHIYQLAGDQGAVTAEVSGAFQYRAADPADFPAVGDWVLYRPGSAGTGIIEQVMNRTTRFSRKIPGSRTEEQLVAANIDVVFPVFAVNGGRNLTPGGVERYMTLAWDSGARPVLLLNKADLCTPDEREQALILAETSAPGAEVILVSAATGEGLERLAGFLKAGTTMAFIGPSGVGKSTLLNALAGATLQRTNAQREGDLRGRHTTTHREMFRLESGVLVVDSPGMRELQLWADGDSLEEAFSDIAVLAEDCRYRDCTHQGEPGCAVQAALAAGELDLRRFENYLELGRELRWLERRQDARLAREDRDKWKQIAKIQRNYKKDQARG